ncbi:phage/plasmid primase, P4 family [uncultured Brevundimonas sp.]|uniref:DNA primase family protein n=1 Tax=uncultured Brevundimonas sp. TaxID=213418 RepID=UPI0025FE9FA5|nr:phage/plasmid primase, P4 family [uncultured Brevundimonas sp.]
MADGSIFDGMGASATPPSPEELSKFELNDDGNAMRFIRMAGGVIDAEGDVDLKMSRVLYLRNRGWIVFNGQFWDLGTGEARAKRHAIKVARAMQPQMAIKVAAMEERNASAKAIQAVYDFGVSAGNASRLNNMMNVAASYLDVDMDAFDQDPMALNCRNGVLRFRRGPHVGPGGEELDGPHLVWTPGHDPADRFTRMCAADYVPGTVAKKFHEVVKVALPVEEERRYVQKAHGYGATGDTGEQAFFIFQGKGGDGKSTVVNAVQHALGTYATTVGIETFLDTGVKRGSEASPDIAALAGDTRMLCAGEPPSGSKLATGQIKQFTGGGKIKARELREGLFEFSPIGKPFIECNRRPVINDTDNGIWRRLKIVPWRVSLSEDRMDHDLPKKLKAEADGILCWLVEGVLMWMREGLKDVAGVKEALEDYRKGANPFVQWLEDRVIRDPEARTGATLLYNDYKRWMEEQGHDKPMSQKAFGGTLGDLQIILAPKDGAGLSTRRGARLRDENDPPPPSASATYSRADAPDPDAGGPESGGDNDAPTLPDTDDWEGGK